jgi:hypothetical protein
VKYFICECNLILLKSLDLLKKIRIINDMLYLTFKSACYVLDFLDDDKEWH